MDATSLGSTPISSDNPAGSDAKYEPEYALVTAEIAKLSFNAQGDVISWPIVCKQGELILAQKAKDLQIAAYVGIGWQETKGIEGLAGAIDLWVALLETFWDTAYPPLAKLKRRTNAFDWWHERAVNWLQKTNLQPQAKDFLDHLSASLSKLDQLTAQLLPDGLLMHDLLDAVRSIPVEAAPEPVPEPEKEPATAASDPPKVESEAKQEPQPEIKVEPKTQGTPTQASVPPPKEVAQPEQSDDLDTAHKNFVAHAINYALLAHRVSPSQPLAWQLMRIALWSKVVQLPPATNGETHILPPDPDRLLSLEKMLKAQKYLDAALSAEDLFTTSIFCFDLQYIIDQALASLDNSFGEARAKVRTETANFLRRLSGVENLAFDGGQPFANETTLAFLTELTTSDTTIGTQNTSSLPQTKSPDNPSTSILGAELFTQAEQLQASGNLLAALQLLEAAKSDSKAHNIRLRLHELNLLCKAQEKQIAAKLAQDLLAEAETLNILNYDFSLGIDILCAARTAFTLTQNKEQMTLVQEQLCKLCPSKALGFKF